MNSIYTRWDRGRRLTKKNFPIGWNLGRRMYEPETLTYWAANPSTSLADIQTIDANIKLIKYSTGISLASVTCNLSIVSGAYFVTNPSVPLSPYALIPGVQFSIAATGTPATTAVFGGCAAGPGETQDSELITSWIGNTYDTFTSSGKDITSAIKSTAGTKYAGSNDLNLSVGALYLNSLNITLNSGSAPGAFWGNSGAVQGVSFVATQLSSGLNNIYRTFSVASSNDYLWLYNGSNGNWSSVNSVKKVLTPTTTGFTASTLVDGGINPNAASYVITIRKAVSVLDQNVTASATHVSTVDGTAFLFSDTVDLSSYGNGKTLVMLTDSTGKSAWGYGKAAGSGETVGGELIDTWTNNGGYETLTLSGSNITQAVSSNADIATARKTHGSAGMLLKHVITAFTLNSGTAPFFIIGTSGTALDGTAAKTITVSGSHTTYTTLGASTTTGFKNNSTNGDWSATGISGKQVLTPTALGLTITSTPGGTTYNFETVTSGFNPNDVTNIKVWSLN